MHEPILQTERQQGGDAMQPSTKPVSLFIRSLSATRFGWRHVKGIAVIRFLVAIWLVCLGSISLGFGYWWGVFLFVAAGLVGWLAYQMPRWKQALDAEQPGRPSR